MDKASAGPANAANTVKNRQCRIYRAINGTPPENMAKVMDLMGGIDQVIGAEDIVLIKPNIQWWNQGASNIAALNTLVRLIMQHPAGFKGEVVILENCHREAAPWSAKNTGWVPVFERNADLAHADNYNTLAASLKTAYGDRFSVVHLLDVDKGGRRVFGPQDGNGYVYCDGSGGVPLIELDNGAEAAHFRKTVMTYPVFTTDRKTRIDFKNGVWANGAYTGQPLKFINFSALNHHSTYCGATSAVKNYLGISDLSGGADPHGNGRLTGPYYNFHSFALDKWAPGPAAGMIGAEVAVFMNTIRKADLNITTAEWVGLVSRTELPAAQTRTVLACTDPVALDYHAAKYVLYPNSAIDLHNPDEPTGPLYQYLEQCAAGLGGILDESRARLTSYDIAHNRLQTDKERIITAAITWGANMKMFIKYALLRHRKGFIRHYSGV